MNHPTPNLLLALDQGTSSSRSIVFNPLGEPVASAQQACLPSYPQPGWVEHDPMALWQTQLATAREALSKAGVCATDPARRVAAVGITNQRETTLVWHRRTGRPVYNAIVWQDRRTQPLCERLQSDGLEDTVRQRTGLRLDPYFSGTKIRWILDEVPGARAAAEAGELAFGTVDTWLLWQLTGGATHATDVSNASRTLLFNIHTQTWDAELLRALRIPASLLPEVRPSCAALPIGGVAGDQQSALFGQACFSPGMVKNTYGTGCFMLMHTGAHSASSQNGLLTTAAAQPGGPPQYALEGSVFTGGAVVQWLRDGLGAIRTSADVQALAQSVPDAGGVVVVPALTGLGSPYWAPDAKGCITGITPGTTMAHIARASLDSIAYQSAALLLAMGRDAQQTGAAPVTELRVDGGACVNDLLMQFQADLLGIPVLRPAVTETTALGAAYLAGLQAGVFQNLAQLADLWRAERTFQPQMPREQAAAHMQRWEHAVRQTLAN